MKKIIAIIAIAGLTFSMTACQKPGSVSGKAINPFTGQAVKNSTIWIDQSTKKAKSTDGSYKFEDVDQGKYTLIAGKNLYSKTYTPFEITETNLNITQDIYIYPKSLKAGLFRPNAEKEDKIINSWYLYYVECDNDDFAYRLQFQNKKTKKIQKLTSPEEIKSDAKGYLFYQPASSTQIIEVTSYPLEKKKISKNNKCAEKIGKSSKTALFPNKDKGTKISVSLKATNLYELSGPYPKGLQALVFTQGGKFLNSYYIDGK